MSDFDLAAFLDAAAGAAATTFTRARGRRKEQEFRLKLQKLKEDADETALKNKFNTTAKANLAVTSLMEHAGEEGFDFEAAKLEASRIQGADPVTIRTTIAALEEAKNTIAQQQGVKNITDIISATQPQTGVLSQQPSFPPGSPAAGLPPFAAAGVTEATRLPTVSIPEGRRRIAAEPSVPSEAFRKEALSQVKFPPTDAGFKAQERKFTASERIRKATEREEKKVLDRAKREREVVERKETRARKTIADVTGLLRRTSKGTLVLQTFRAFQAGENIDSGTVLNNITTELDKTKAGRRMKRSWQEAFNVLFGPETDDVDSLVADFEEQERRAKQ